MSEFLSSLFIELLGASLVALIAATVVCRRLYSRVQRALGREGRVCVITFPSSPTRAEGQAWLASLLRRGFRVVDDPAQADTVVLWDPRDAAGTALETVRAELRAGAVIQVYTPVRLPCEPGDAMLANSVGRLELDLQGVLGLAARG